MIDLFDHNLLAYYKYTIVFDPDYINKSQIDSTTVAFIMLVHE